ncbi:hypothetical protein [Sporosarcina sp. P20a]|nr:hypothetical protein [Sporosarcina sp. P20a]
MKKRYVVEQTVTHAIEGRLAVALIGMGTSEEETYHYHDHFEYGIG